MRVSKGGTRPLTRMYRPYSRAGICILFRYPIHLALPNDNDLLAECEIGCKVPFLLEQAEVFIACKFYRDLRQIGDIRIFGVDPDIVQVEKVLPGYKLILRRISDNYLFFLILIITCARLSVL